MPGIDNRTRSCLIFCILFLTFVIMHSLHTPLISTYSKGALLIYLLVARGDIIKFNIFFLLQFSRWIKVLMQ